MGCSLSSTGGAETLESQGDRRDPGRSGPAGRADRGCPPRPAASPIRRGCGAWRIRPPAWRTDAVRRAALGTTRGSIPLALLVANHVALASSRRASPLASRASSPRGRRSSSARAGALLRAELPLRDRRKILHPRHARLQRIRPLGGRRDEVRRGVRARRLVGPRVLGLDRRLAASRSATGRDGTARSARRDRRPRAAARGRWPRRCSAADAAADAAGRRMASSCSSPSSA